MLPISEAQESIQLELARSVDSEEEIHSKIRKLTLEGRARRREQRLRLRKSPRDSSQSSSDDTSSDEEHNGVMREEMNEKRVAPEDDFQGRSMVRAATFARIWNWLTDDGLEDDPGEVDKGWLNALQALRKDVTVTSYAPTSVLHRVMTQAMRDHRDMEVRTAAYEFLTKCCEMLPVPSGNTEEKLEMQIKAGPALVLQFIVSLLTTDLEHWYSYLLRGGEMSRTAQPILARILYTDTTIRWNRRCEVICNKYIAALQKDVSPVYLSCLRSLVGQMAQLLHLSERRRSDNRNKAEVARYLGSAMHGAALDPDRVESELFLLQPTWLSAATSAFHLARFRNMTYTNGIPNLRELVVNFVNTDIKLTADKASGKRTLSPDDSASLSPVRTKTVPTTVKASPLQSSTNKDRSRPKVNVHKRNKYGETALHTACKMGNLARIADCLGTPGVDINAADHIGSTPLHEAIIKNREEAVRMLLDYRPVPTIERYFSVTPVKRAGAGSQERAPKSCVNLLAVAGTETKFSPLQEAVESNKIKIVRMIFEKVAESRTEEQSEFPPMASLLNSKTSDQRSLLDLCGDNPAMQQLIRDYTSRASQSAAAPAVSLKAEDSRLFGLLLENSLVQYMSALCLPQVYRVWKVSKTEPGYSPTQLKNAREDGQSVELPQALRMWQPLSFEDGLVALEDSHTPRFELHRSDLARAQDAKDFEKLRFYSTLLPNVGTNHPILSFLRITDQSVK